MKKLVTICVVVTMVLAMTGMANAGITDNPNYVPSSSLTLGGVSGRGYIVPQEFQFNLVYQPGIDDSAIDALNNYGVSMTPPRLNYPDYVVSSGSAAYYLQVNTSGSLPIGIWDFKQGYVPASQYFAPDSGASWVQWTLSYYEQLDAGTPYHTILAGDIVSDSGGSFLRVRPPQSYRSFLWDGFANDVEVFEGAIVYSEVLGYSYSGTLGGGTVLTPMLDSSTVVPAPGAILLGSIGVTLVGWMRRRRTL